MPSDAVVLSIQASIEQREQDGLVDFLDGAVIYGGFLEQLTGEQTRFFLPVDDLVLEQMIDHVPAVDVVVFDQRVRENEKAVVEFAYEVVVRLLNDVDAVRKVFALSADVLLQRGGRGASALNIPVETNDAQEHTSQVSCVRTEVDGIEGARERPAHLPDRSSAEV